MNNTKTQSPAASEYSMLKKIWNPLLWSHFPKAQLLIQPTHIA